MCAKPIRSFGDCMSLCARRLQVAGIEIQLGVLQVQSGSYSYRGFEKVCSTMPPLFHRRMWVNCCSSQRHRIPQYTPIELMMSKSAGSRKEDAKKLQFLVLLPILLFLLF